MLLQLGHFSLSVYFSISPLFSSQTLRKTSDRQQMVWITFRTSCFPPSGVSHESVEVKEEIFNYVDTNLVLGMKNTDKAENIKREYAVDSDI